MTIGHDLCSKIFSKDINIEAKGNPLVFVKVSYYIITVSFSLLEYLRLSNLGVVSIFHDLFSYFIRIRSLVLV